MNLPRDPVTWSLAVASNSDEILKNNLLKSGEAAFAGEIIVERHASSAAEAYNTALDKCRGDIVVFAHQDVYLPPGWSECLLRSIERLNNEDSSWGILGVYGVTSTGSGFGRVYSTGLGRFVGQSIAGPVPVATVDEMLLVMRRLENLRFDGKLPGFHLYGTDICLEAEALGLRNYVMPCFAFHNSVGVKHLPASFWQAYLYLRKKWKHILPVLTPCTRITRSCMPMIRHMMRSRWAALRGKNNPGSRVDDPALFYLKHLKQVADSF